MTGSTISPSSADFAIPAAARCALCLGGDLQREARVTLAAMRRYWLAFGYDLDAEFPDAPDALQAWRCGGCGLGWFEPALIGGPSLYAALGQWPAYYQDERWEWAIALDLLQRSGAASVVEIGAGTGAFVARAAVSVPHVTGLEFNEAAVAMAQARGRPVVNRELGDLPREIDAIVAFQVLEHLSDPAGLIAECRDKLAAGGIIIVTTPNDDGAVGSLTENFLNLPPHHATRWRRASFEAAARRFDLALIDYRVEPLTPELYRLYRLRRLRPAASIPGKLLNVIRRAAISTTLDRGFARDRSRIGGETHLAAFRKN
jgi:SAM-dependent methyltransferase